MLKRILAVATAALAVLSGAAQATNYTDIWWNPAERGWGVNLAQSDKFIFATFFVYGPGNVPIWYAGNLVLDASGAYTGGLYATTGTYFGTVPYNPAEFSAPQVGTASFRPSAADRGVLTYNVAGVPVTKNIQRQTLTPVPLSGSYSGGLAVVDSACPNPADNGPFDLPVTIAVVHTADNRITVTLDVFGLGIGACTLASAGTPTQAGQLFSFAGTITCTGDAPYVMAVSELRATSLGIEGRWAGSTNDGCREEGRFSGVNLLP